MLIKNAKICKSCISKTIGLMFSKKRSLVLAFEEEKKISLHMFFVFYPIDVLFLDKNKRVVEIKRNFKPFRTYTSKKKARYAVEVPKGMLKKIKLGEIVSFK